MVPAQVLDRFLERCPAVVMVRATLERLLRPERLDQIFEDASQRQYSKRLLFSQVVAMMTAVATRTHASVHAAYLDARDRLDVSVASLYNKLNLMELGTSEALVRETAADAAAVVDAIPAAKAEVLPGFEVFYLDGDHLSSTEHRLAELRTTREGPLPGQTLALLDARRGLIVELRPARTATPRSGRSCRRCWRGSARRRSSSPTATSAPASSCSAWRRGRLLRDPAARLDVDLEAPRPPPPGRPDRHRDGLRAGDGAPLRGIDAVGAPRHARPRSPD